MATKANSGGPHGMHQHTAGIFADMTVDGPEIGTLVVIVDRAKNLPNRKTMGKQNPFCAARLGKDAKKTETDKRGGQTPKWDQELRFTVHDSPDYHSLKVSIFSEDKRTDLIGEALVELTDILKQGGGQGDIWQGLTCKGKYAGEVRIEMTYYDTRPKPEKPAEAGAASKVKRRPLPTNPSGPRGINTDAIPGPREPVRVRHGTREYSTPPRQNSLPPESINYAAVEHGYTNQLPPSHGHHGEPQVPSQNYHEEPQELEGQTPFDPNGYGQLQQPDFLPELPPSNRQRGSVPTEPIYAARQTQPLPQQTRPLPQATLPHSHSAPVVPHVHQENPGYEEPSHLRTDYPEPIPDLDYQHQNLRQRRNDVPPGWENPYENAPPGRQAYMEDEDEPPPPPPPMHSNSAPEVPHYHNPNSHQATPSPNRAPWTPNGRQQYIQNGSPRGYGNAQYTPPNRSQSGDDFTTPPHQQGINGTPLSLVPGQTPSPQQWPPRQPIPHRHSVADAYAVTPPRPHPLSQEVSRARSPNPYGGHQHSASSSDLYQQPQYPAALDTRQPPQPPHAGGMSPGAGLPALRPSSARNPYTLRHPVQSFESSDNSPLSTSRQDPRSGQTPISGMPPRKSVSPQPSPTSSIPFSPDSFDIHNPTARSPAPSQPRNPYRDAPSTSDSRQQPNGSIVGWDGREIDPSDHLPVDSWAPEPEKKTPSKTYGLGRDRDFGPRHSPTANSTPLGSGGGKNLSRDTKINVRMKAAQQAMPKSGNGTPERPPGSSIPPIPNPYAQEGYSPSARFREASPGIGRHRSYQNLYDARGFYGDGGPPGLPPKLPLQQQQQQMMGYGGGGGYGGYASGEDALAQEIGSIDLGPSPVNGARPHGRSLPTPTAYVPVRSQRDRGFY
ncbi:hypothetical protein MBLNU230_g4062t1 [Neophaeotheca triangularis]